MGSTTFINGKVFTARSEDDFASAFRIVDGRFDWVGDVTDLGDDEKAAAHDLEGARVVPGLLDMHTHPAFTGTLAGAVQVLPPAVSSIEELVATLAAQPSVGDGDAWILGFGYDESAYPEGRKPNRHDLDRISTTQPVLVRRCDAHSAVCNTRALEIAGITAHTPDPVGGVFGREADGTPDGILTEPPAVDAVEKHRPVATRDDLATTIAALDEHYLAQGLVGMCDLLSTFVADPIETFRLAQQKGFRQQCALYYGWKAALDARPDGFTEEEKFGRVYVAGLKMFLDGAFSDRTAWCKDPYPGGADVGMRIDSDEDIARVAAYARTHGLQLAFHAMGDQAIQTVIDVFADEEPWLDVVPCVRIDHATLIDDAMLAQIDSARMTFAIISHTIFYFAEYGAYEAALSPAQAEEAYPIRRYYASSVPSALASDAPATAWSEADHVFTSVRAAVVRRSHTGADIGQGQSITLPQALLLYTDRAARVARLDGLGRIQAGYEGSFVVLDRDPFELDPNDLDQVQVAQTWVAGELAHQR